MTNLCIAIASLVLMLVACGKESSDVATQIRDSEARIDSSLAAFEQAGMLEEALESYQTVEEDLLHLGLGQNDPDYREQQRVLAYALLRIGNILRQLGRMEEALQAGGRELEFARNSGDTITLARTLMSHGTTLIVSGNVDNGLSYVKEARPLFERGTSFDHKQGLGWYWILQAELALAGMTTAEPEKIVEYASTALAVLMPIENWPGVARAYGARAQAYETLGKAEAAADDRTEQAKYEAMVGSSSSR